MSSPAAQAHAVLTQAQEIAERRIAQADARLAEAERLAAEQLAGAQAGAAARLSEVTIELSRRIDEADQAAALRLARGEALAEQVLGRARQESLARRAQAVQDARRLLLNARTRYEDIVVRAHQRADYAAEVALDDVQARSDVSHDAGRQRVELELKAAYLRTFAKVSRAALQAALEVTAREFDRLLSASASLESELGLAVGVADVPVLRSVGPPAGAAGAAGAQSRPAAFSAR